MEAEMSLQPGVLPCLWAEQLPEAQMEERASCSAATGMDLEQVSGHDSGDCLPE